MEENLERKQLAVTIIIRFLTSLEVLDSRRSGGRLITII